MAPRRFLCQDPCMVTDLAQPWRPGPAGWRAQASSGLQPCEGQRGAEPSTEEDTKGPTLTPYPVKTPSPRAAPSKDSV